MGQVHVDKGVIFHQCAPALTLSLHAPAAPSRAVFNGAGGVEVFLLLSGLLAAWSLVPALAPSKGGARRPAEEAQGRQVVLAYWRRRAARILPPYLAANALVWLATRGGSPGGQQGSANIVAKMAFSGCPRGLWANLAFVSNVYWTEICGEGAGRRLAPSGPAARAGRRLAVCVPLGDAAGWAH